MVAQTKKGLPRTIGQPNCRSLHPTPAPNLYDQPINQYHTYVHHTSNTMTSPSTGITHITPDTTIHIQSPSTSIVHPTDDTTFHMTTSPSTSIIMSPTPDTTFHMTSPSTHIVQPTSDTTIYMTSLSTSIVYTSHSWQVLLFIW